MKVAWTEFEAWLRDREGESNRSEPLTKEMAVQTLVDEPAWMQMVRDAGYLDDVIEWYNKTHASAYQ